MTVKMSPPMPPLVTFFAINEQARDFYRKIGFIESGEDGPWILIEIQ